MPLCRNILIILQPYKPKNDYLKRWVLPAGYHILNMKKTLIAALLLASAVGVFAQSGTNSPYSQIGLGLLSDQSTGSSRGMNGLSYGLREHNQVNFSNPASYSAVDSLSFIFDVAMSLQATNFEEKGNKKNANSAVFEYAVGLFRAAKHVGVSFGVIPYTAIGYSYFNKNNVNAFPSLESQNATYTNTYAGTGGTRQVFVGAGWEPLRGLSVGANVSYLWGDYTKEVVNTYSESAVNTLSKIYKAEVSSYKLDFGLQYSFDLTKKDNFTLGLAYGLGHELSGDPECDFISSNSQTGVQDSSIYKVNKGLRIPHTFGAGLLWTHANQWKVGVDYQYQKWKNIEWPNLINEGAATDYVLQSGQFNDRHKFTLGGEYCQGERYRGFFRRLHYRAGVSYATPYQKINGQNGPRELSATLGLGIPIVNNYNNRSVLNISAQWVNLSGNGFLKENTFRINVGLTFNERWFAKFKVE